MASKIIDSDLPQRTDWLYRGFAKYAQWYVRRNTHAVRMLREGSEAFHELAGRPVLVVLNHPTWWDPLLAQVVANRFFSSRDNYAPIDAEAVQQYKFFERIGYFGIERDTRRGAARFLRIGEAALQQPDGALWVTAQGHFTDPRRRPISIRPGVAHLCRRLGEGGREAWVLPLAMELTYWEERYPEALLAVSPPLLVDGTPRSTQEWQERIEAALESTMDRLAAAAVAREAKAFETWLGGSAGVGGVYDFWRRTSAWLTGRRFDPSHSRPKDVHESAP